MPSLHPSIRSLLRPRNLLYVIPLGLMMVGGCVGSPPQIQQGKIVQDGTYNGVFLGDFDINNLGILRGALGRYERQTNEHVDILMFYHAFIKGFEFPEQTSKFLIDRGTVPFIKFEPWSWKGRSDMSYSLGKINSGALDEEIGQFAKGAAQFNKPFFITFGQEMNGKAYPWSGKSQQYVAAYRHVVNIFNANGATSATWVWNIDAQGDYSAYYPGNEYVDFIAVDAFSWDAGHGTPSPDQLFEIAVNKLRADYPDKPVMIGETSYDSYNGGTQKEKAAFAAGLPRFCRANNLAAMIMFDCHKFDESKERDWSLDPESARAMGRSIDETGVFGTAIRTTGNK